MRIALIGNPNCGKTTLFNVLTGAERAVGNWSGVTIGLEAGNFSLAGESCQLLDLPGLYSLETASPEQKTVVAALEQEKPDLLLNVVNSTNLERQLFLSTQLVELGLPLCIALNMADELSGLGLELDENRLAAELGFPCVKISAANGEGLDRLLTMIQETGTAQKREPAGEGLDAQSRYARVEKLVAVCLRSTKAAEQGKFSPDAVFCHPCWGIPVLIGMSLLLFWLSFGPVTGFFSTLLERLCQEELYPSLQLLLYRLGLGPWLRGLLLDGAFAGVVSVLLFLPQLSMLFFCLALLESSGYMARAAFLSDRALSRFGLNGLSFIPMLLSFGCTVPGLTACRIMEDPTQRRRTMGILPLLSCSARLPVYAFVVERLFPGRAWLWISGLYLLGLLLALLKAWLARGKGGRAASLWMLELPPYRRPRWKLIRRSLWHRCREFLSRAGTAVLLASVFLWLLSHFSPGLRLVDEMSGSILAATGRIIAPLLAPFGCGHWQIAVALCCGLLAKESIVAALTVTNAELGSLLSPAAGAAFLVFVLLYTPCVAALATARRESGSWCFSLGMAAGQFLLAWVMAALAFQACIFLGV